MSERAPPFAASIPESPSPSRVPAQPAAAISPKRRGRGRPRALTPQQEAEIREARRLARTLTWKALAKRYGVSRHVIGLTVGERKKGR